MMKVPALVVLILGSVHLACSDSHSLSVVATLISGSTQFPEFTAVLLVNDVAVEYYDSDMKKVVSRRRWRINDTMEEAFLTDYGIADVYTRMKIESDIMMKRSNHTQGVHVYQRFTACDLEDDKISRFFVSSAYDGEEKCRYDALTHTQNTLVPELVWSKLKSDVRKQMYSIYQPLFVRALRRYLQEDKNILLRKEDPTVRVIQKKHPGSRWTKVTCLATGFYPRRVNMTLLRDERPVPDQQLTGGQVLSNGDGTYQLRRSLSVSEEELRERYRYTCTVSHLSVDNKLDISWELEAPADTVLMCVALLSVLAVTGLIIITAIVLCRKRRCTGLKNLCPSAGGVKYAAAQKSGTDSSSSSSGSS